VDSGAPVEVSAILSELYRQELDGISPATFISELRETRPPAAPWRCSAQLRAEYRRRDWMETLARASRMPIDEGRDELAAFDERHQPPDNGWKPANITGWLLDDPPSRDWIFTDRLARGDVGAITGAGGLGKSFLTLELCVSLATGKTLLPAFAPSRPGRVLCLFGEDPEPVVHARLRAVVDAFGLWGHGASLHDNLRIFAGVSEPLLVAPGGVPERTERWRWLKREVEAFSPDLILIDPKARFDGADENSNAHATAFVVAIQDLCGSDASVLVLHHIAKTQTGQASSDAGRGATAFRDGLRWSSTMTAITEAEAKRFSVDDCPRKYVRFDVVKSNYAEDLPTIYLERCEGGVLKQADLRVTRKAGIAELISAYLMSKSGTEAYGLPLRNLRQGRGDAVKEVKEFIENELGCTTWKEIKKAVDEATKTGLLVVSTDTEYNSTMVFSPSTRGDLVAQLDCATPPGTGGTNETVPAISGCNEYTYDFEEGGATW